MRGSTRRSRRWSSSRRVATCGDARAVIPPRRVQHNRSTTPPARHGRRSLRGVPVRRRLALGTWQQLVLIDFDDRPRERTVVVQVLASAASGVALVGETAGLPSPRSPSSIGPKRTRRRESTRLPIASAMRRTWRLRPSRRTISISRSSRRRTSAGAVGPSSSSTPSARRRRSSSPGGRRSLHPVGLRHFVARVGEAVGQLAVVGEQQQAGRVGVEPADRVEARLALDQADHRRPRSGLLRGRDDAGRLVDRPDLTRLRADQRRRRPAPRRPPRRRAPDP